MNRVGEAIDEAGIPRPLEELALAEQLVEWRRVYEGLSDAEIAEVEAIALDRSHFSRAGSSSSGS